jgi:hypothetical protein
VSTPAATANAGRIHTLSLDDELLQAVSDRAHQARPGRAVLGFIGAVLFTIGWIAAKGLRAFFFCGAWAFAAVAVGWHQARGEAPAGPSLEQLIRENEMLRLELKRISPTMS